jgi:5'-3' exonuclease
MGVKDLLKILSSEYKQARPHVIFRLGKPSETDTVENYEYIVEDETICSVTQASCTTSCISTAPSANGNITEDENSLFEEENIGNEIESYDEAELEATCEDFDIDLRGKIVGVDVATYVFPLTKLKGSFTLQFLTSKGPNTFVAQRFDERVLKPLIEQAGVSTVVLVFDGLAYEPKKSVSTERRRPRNEAKVQLEKMKEKFRALGTGNFGVGKKENAECLQHMRTLLGDEMKVAAAPDECIMSSIKDYALHKYGKNKVKIRIAAHEADSQLVSLQKERVIEYILSIDSDIIALGADHVIYRFNGNTLKCLYLTQKYCLNLLRRQMGLSDEHYITPALMYMFSTILGTDYVPRVNGFGRETTKRFMRSVFLEGMDDALEEHCQGGKRLILEGKEISKETLKNLWSEGFNAGWFHPVFKGKDVIRVTTLHDPFVSGVPHYKAASTAAQTSDPQKVFFDETREKKFSQDEFLFWGSDIDFITTPICMIPSELLLQWCTTRGLNVPGNVERSVLEIVVDAAVRVKQKVPASLLKAQKSSYEPIFFFRCWRKYERISIPALMENVVNVKLPELSQICPYISIIKRGAVLFKGGHVLFEKIEKGIGIYIPDEKIKVTLYRIQVVASFRTITYSTLIGFKGQNLSTEVSGCSCVAGNLFCSHQIALVLLIVALKSGIVTEENLLKIMPTSVKEIDATAVPVSYAVKVLEHNRRRKHLKQRGKEKIQEDVEEQEEELEVLQKGKKRSVLKQLNKFIDSVRHAEKMRDKQNILNEDVLTFSGEAKHMDTTYSEVIEWLKERVAENLSKIKTVKKSELQEALKKELTHPLDIEENIRKQEDILRRLYLGISEYNKSRKKGEVEYKPAILSLAQYTYENSKENHAVSEGLPWKLGEF